MFLKVQNVGLPITFQWENSLYYSFYSLRIFIIDAFLASFYGNHHHHQHCVRSFSFFVMFMNKEWKFKILQDLRFCLFPYFQGRDWVCTEKVTTMICTEKQWSNKKNVFSFFLINLTNEFFYSYLHIYFNIHMSSHQLELHSFFLFYFFLLFQVSHCCIFGSI